MALKTTATTLAGFNAWADANRGIEIVSVHVQGDNSTVNVFYKELHVTALSSGAGDRVKRQPPIASYSRTDING